MARLAHYLLPGRASPSSFPPHARGTGLSLAPSTLLPAQRRQPALEVRAIFQGSLVISFSPVHWPGIRVAVGLD